VIYGEVNQADLRRIEAKVKHWRDRVFGDLLNRVAQRVAKQTRHRITREKASPDGVPWPPRVGDDDGHPLLEKSGALVSAIRAARQAEDLIHVAPFGVSYAPFLQFGTRKMEAREYAGLSSENVQDLESVINSWVNSRA
jgi:phage gpG-like protein